MFKPGFIIHSSECHNYMNKLSDSCNVDIMCGYLDQIGLHTTNIHTLGQRNEIFTNNLVMLIV